MCTEPNSVSKAEFDRVGKKSRENNDSSEQAANEGNARRLPVKGGGGGGGGRSGGCDDGGEEKGGSARWQAGGDERDDDNRKTAGLSQPVDCRWSNQVERFSSFAGTNQKKKKQTTNTGKIMRTTHVTTMYNNSRSRILRSPIPKFLGRAVVH